MPFFITSTVSGYHDSVSLHHNWLQTYAICNTMNSYISQGVPGILKYTLNNTRHNPIPSKTCFLHSSSRPTRARSRSWDIWTCSYLISQAGLKASLSGQYTWPWSNIKILVLRKVMRSFFFPVNGCDKICLSIMKTYQTRFKIKEQFSNRHTSYFDYVLYNIFWCCNTIYAFNYT